MRGLPAYSPGLTAAWLPAVRGSKAIRRMSCHGLPIANGQLAGAGHVDRAKRVCLACDKGAVGNEKDMVLSVMPWLLLRQQHAHLFTLRAPFFVQQDHLEVLSYVMDCLTVMSI